MSSFLASTLLILSRLVLMVTAILKYLIFIKKSINEKSISLYTQNQPISLTFTYLKIIMSIQKLKQSAQSQFANGNQIKQQLSYEFRYGQSFKLFFQFKSIKLSLFRSFNTAHSSTTIRNNFFVKLKLTVSQEQVEPKYLHFYGAGQSGLPPKKPKCYLADLNNCLQFAKQYEKKIIIDTNAIQNAKKTFTDQFSQKENYFQNLLKSKYAEKFCYLISCIHKFSNPAFRAARCALQFALFDLWSNYKGITLYQGIFGSQILKKEEVAEQKCGFYTVSYEQHQKMVQNGQNAKKVTDFIKIKYTNKPKQLINLLNTFHQRMIGIKWIVDLNSSWSPKQWHQFYALLTSQPNKQLIPKICYIEQPFEIQLSQEDLKQWAKIKQETVIKIIADQSFSVPEDIEKVGILCHGVNIKNQKTGGLINSLKSALSCRKHKLDIMFGSMVSTQLGSSQCFQLRKFSNLYDADGALLVQTPAFQGGFTWKSGGFLYPCQQNKGIGFPHEFYVDSL